MSGEKKDSSFEANALLIKDEAGLGSLRLSKENVESNWPAIGRVEKNSVERGEIESLEPDAQNSRRCPVVNRPFLREVGGTVRHSAYSFADLFLRTAPNRTIFDRADRMELSNVVPCHQPLFDRLATIISLLIRHQDFELARMGGSQELHEVSRENLKKPCNILPVLTESILGPRDFVHSRNFAEWILKSQSRIGIASSGTTGKPKWVYHTMETLARSVKVSPNHRDDIWGLAYSPDRFAGMQVFLQAICNLNTIVSLLGLLPDEIHDSINANSITHLSATPTWFRLLLNGNRKHEKVRSITVGGEVCHPSLLTSLQSLFPNARFHNIYASTEAGALFRSNSDAFVVPKELTELVRVHEGQLWLHESLIAKSLRVNSLDTFFPTGDEVEIIEDAPLTMRFLARRSDWINVGGIKVNPHAVEDALLQIEGIHEAKVFAIKSSVVGNLVCAEIILDATVKYTVADIRGILSSRLDHYSIPRIIHFVSEISMSPSGKKRRDI